MIPEALEQTLVNWGLVTGAAGALFGLATLQAGPEGFAYRQRYHVMGRALLCAFAGMFAGAVWHGLPVFAGWCGRFPCAWEMGGSWRWW